MIKIDENDPIGEVDPSFPYRDVVIRKNTDMKEFYDLQKEIGRGKFGTVYRCTEKSTGLKLAAKFIGISKRQDRRNAEREVEIMRELQHPRLIQMYDAFEINNIMCVVLELIEGGELFERVIDDDFILTEKSVSVFMRQICEGIAFIHSKNILHLDMKPENILCLTKTGNRIKIIDFGLARKYDPEKKLQVLFGTPEFVAPEVVNFDSIGFGTDMWSVGVICYVLLSGLSPFMGETDVQTMANVTIAQYDFDDEAFNDISADAKEFIGKLLLKDREQRMSATECLSHRWLQRRKPPVSSNPPSIPNSPSELDLQKDTLRYLVDRWNNDTNIALVVNNDDKCDKVIDICKMNGITEHQSKSQDVVCEPNSLAAKNLRTSAQSAVGLDEGKFEEKSNKLENTTLVPIQSIETPPVSNQGLKSLPDVATDKPTINLNKRSLSPDTAKVDSSKKDSSVKIPKSESSSRSGSNSPAISEQPLFNGEAENAQAKFDEKLPKPSLLDVPKKPPQQQSSDGKKSPSTSPKPSKKPLTKTPSPSIKDQASQKDELITNQEEITTDQSSQRLPKSPSLLEIPKKLPRVESADKTKSPSISPKPLKKTPVKTPSPTIKEQAGPKDELITNQEEIITDQSSQKLPKSPSLLEIPRKLPQEESAEKTKSPSISPKPLKKTPVKTPSPTIKDQSDQKDGLMINQADLVTDLFSQKLPKSSLLLETPQNLPREDSADKTKSPSISPKPLKKTPVKTPSPSIKDHQTVQKDETTADQSCQKLPKSQSLLEIPQKLSSAESADTSKSPSTSPKPLKKIAVKTPSPTIKDQSNLQNEPVEDKPSQELSKISLLEVPKKPAQTESSTIKKSPSTSPKPLKKKPAKTPSPSVQELQSDHQDVVSKSAESATLEKSPQRDISTGKNSPTVSEPVINFAKVVVNEFQEVVDKRLSTSDKICDTLKETPAADKTSTSINSQNFTSSSTSKFNAGKSNEKLNTKDSKNIRSSPTPGGSFAQGNNDNLKFKDKLQDIPSADPTSQSSPLRTPTVEISDETYEYVKKRRFTIKSVESTKTVDKTANDSTSHTKSIEKTTTTESSPQPHRRSIFSPEVSPKVLRKINNFVSTSELMKRRISDISNLLSRRSEHDVEQSIPDEMSSFCSKLNRIVRMRHDSYSIDGSSNFKRPKFRISYFSRDVPLASTPPLHADLLNYLPFGDDTGATPVWSFQKTNPFHSDPSSLRNSPERFASPSLTKKLLSKFFNDSLEYDISSTPSTSTNGLPKDKITGIIS